MAAEQLLSMDSTPDLDLTSVTKRFGDHLAVDDVSFTVSPGEFFSILGPSGCGKTTLVRMIAGFEEPSAGEIRIRGRSVLGVPANRRPCNMVFQSLALFPMMSVGENIAYGLRCHGVGKAEAAERTRRMLDRVGLPGFADRSVATLSGGQRQRVAIARCLVLEPTLVLLDEPLGALDLKLREQMQVELKGIQRDVGITFLFVTHDQEEALTLSDRVAVFNEGRIEQVGTAREVYEQPASGFVAGFVGTSNLLAGAAARAVIGREGSFAIRPEKLLIAPAGDLARADGLMGAEAVLEEVVYGGPVTRYVVALDAGARLTALEQNTGAHQSAAHLRRGERVRIQWNPEHVIDVPESVSG